MQHVDVVLFTVRPDQVRLAQTSLRQDRPHGRGVVLCVDPVAHVQAVAVELRTDAGEHVGDLARDELLDVLARAVVVRAVRDGGTHSVGAEPRAHQHVGRCLGGAVRAARTVRRLLREARRVVQCEVAVHLVGGDVVEAHVVLARGLQQAKRAVHVGAHERLRVGDGVVVVGLGGEVHDGVHAGDDLLQQRLVADVAVDEGHALLGDAGEVVQVAGIGERVQHDDVHVRLVVHHPVDEVASDEPGSAGDDDALRFEDL